MKSIIKYLLSLVLLIGCALLTFAQSNEPITEPSSKPMLRVEAGMHTSQVNKVAVDSANRYLVTASDDKTVRVWEVATGKLLKIIRPPVREGDEGKLYAVAISPDGETIAAAGWTGHDWDGTASVYLFNRQTGHVIRRMERLPTSIMGLAYSPDGKLLAVTMAFDQGLHLYETENYTLAGKDSDYGKDTYGVEFDKTGRLLVTASLDGFVRLYEIGSETALRLIAKKDFGKKWPLAASFSPDGTKIAVGFFKNPSKIEVVSGKDLSSSFSAKAADSKNGFSNVAWSADGNTLYAGGTYNYGGKNLICAWDKSGKGQLREIPVSQSQIKDIIRLNDGGVVYSTSDPVIGIIDANGKVARYIGPPIAAYGRGQYQFLLSADGSTVQFNYDELGRSPARFSIFKRRLEDVFNQSLENKIPDTQNLRPPSITADGISVVRGEEAFSAKLNGKPLPLESLESPLHLAIAPDKRRFLLGTLFYIRLFDKEGQELWRVTVPGVTQGVNISADGELAVAAFFDGTIRWYRMTDGEELLVFFPHADKERWVLWTKEGYYDASPGAEDLIGWHVNNGKESVADFFPLGLLRTAFYRPDIIEKVLKTKNIASAVKQANKESGRQSPETDVARMLPPVVEIISSTRNTTAATEKVTVRYRVRTPSGEPVTKISVLINGKLVSTENKIEAEQVASIREISLTIPARNGEISIIAENRFFAGSPATMRVP